MKNYFSLLLLVVACVFPSFAQNISETPFSGKIKDIPFDSIAYLYHMPTDKGTKVYLHLKKRASIAKLGKREALDVEGIGFIELDNGLNVINSDYALYYPKGKGIINKIYDNPYYAKPARDRIVATSDNLLKDRGSAIVERFPDLKGVGLFTIPNNLYGNKIDYKGLWQKVEGFKKVTLTPAAPKEEKKVLGLSVTTSGGDQIMPGYDRSEELVEMASYKGSSKNEFWAWVSDQVSNPITGDVYGHHKYVNKKKDKKVPYEEKVEFVTFDESGKEKYRKEVVFTTPYQLQETFVVQETMEKNAFEQVKSTVFLYSGKPSKKYPNIKRTDQRVLLRNANGEIIMDHHFELVSEKSKIFHAIVMDNNLVLLGETWKGNVALDSYIFNEDGLIKQESFKDGSDIYQGMLKNSSSPDGNLEFHNQFSSSMGDQLMIYKGTNKSSDLRSGKVSLSTTFFLFTLGKDGTLKAANRIKSSDKVTGHQKGLEVITENNGKIYLAFSELLPEPYGNGKSRPKPMLQILETNPTDLKITSLEHILIPLHSIHSFFVMDGEVLAISNTETIKDLSLRNKIVKVNF